MWCLFGKEYHPHIKVLVAWHSVVLIVFLFWFVFPYPTTLSDTEMGIEYDNFAEKFGDFTQTNRHVLPTYKEIFTVPSSIITNDIELECVSNNGIFINLVISHEYQLGRAHLKDMYKNYGDDRAFDSYIDDFVTSVVRNVCSMFHSQDFFNRRGDVEAEIIRSVSLTLSSSTYIKTGSLQLENIALPEAYLQSFIDKQEKFEQIEVAMNERVGRVTEAQTTNKEERLQADIDLLDATISGNTTIETSKKVVSSILTIWNERAEGYSLDMEGLSINPIEYLESYLLPRIEGSTLTGEQQLCLSRCKQETSCWYCFVGGGNVVPSVPVV